MNEFHKQAKFFRDTKPEMQFAEFEHKMINHFERKGMYGNGNLTDFQIVGLYSKYFGKNTGA